MLVEFRVQNHRSVRDEQALTFEAASLGDGSDQRPRVIPGHAARLLTVAALYGANASGKSNVLAALGFMREAVMSSQRLWAPEGVRREPFAWGPQQIEPSLFEVTFVIDGVRHEYGFLASDERFLEEWLYAWPLGRKQMWFERDADDFKFGEHLKGENRLVQEVTRPNALFLSAAVQLRHAQLRPVFNWFQWVRTMKQVRRPVRSRLTRARAPRSPEEPQLPDRLPGPRWDRTDLFRDLLRAADLGIVDFKEVDDPALGHRVLVQHRSDVGEAWLPLEQESQGTATLFHLGPLLVDVLRAGGVLVVDELDASLHPLLAADIVRRFNDPATNPRNAQLVFTTHDTHLLGTVLGAPALRRDQVWLTEKDAEGATCLYPLTEFRPRKAENLERGYLQGRYGAIPFLGALGPMEAPDGE